MVTNSAKFTFDCPECNKDVNFHEAYQETNVGSDVHKVSLVCPYCKAENISYYSNSKIRNNIRKLRAIKENSKVEFSSNRMEEYYQLQQRHQKYFDKFQLKMRQGE
jgi:transcription initiation factor IIE alpha subunit